MKLFPNRKVDPHDKSRWQFWRWENINREGRTYLSRLVIFKTPLLSCYLHNILLPDHDVETLHTHPWHFISLILRGGYIELMSHNPPGNIVFNSVLRFNYKNTKTAHRIISVLPNTWSLVLTGPKLKSWGFFKLNNGSFIDWTKYEKGFK